MRRNLILAGALLLLMAGVAGAVTIQSGGFLRLGAQSGGASGPAPSPPPILPGMLTTVVGI